MWLALAANPADESSQEAVSLHHLGSLIYDPRSNVKDKCNFLNYINIHDDNDD